MNKIIKSLLVLAVVAFTFNATAQITLGGKAGINLNNQSFSYEDADFEPATKMAVGFHIGVAAEMEFSDKLALQTGLLFTQKGAATDLEDDLPDGVTIDGSSKTVLSYLEIPLHVALKTESGFQAYAGPFVAFSMGGKMKNDYTTTFAGMDTENTEDSDIKPIFGDIEEGDLKDDESGVSALDFGFDFGIGYLLSDAFLLNAGYSLGLGNLRPGIDGSEFDPADAKSSNSVISVSATYWFGK